MIIASRRLTLCGAIFSLLLAAASAVPASSQTVPVTPLQRQLDRIDFGVSALGQFSSSTSGTSYLPQSIQQTPSNTVGAIVELRYIRSPLVGIELNYTYARYTENFNLNNTSGTPAAQTPYVLGVQAKVNEYSLGYVAHTPQYFGVKPFIGGGLGAIEFKPTSGGGEGLLPQERVGIYYTLGVEQNFLSDHFGIRAQFRQIFFGAPDFNENYLATGARSYTVEPAIGFFLRF